MMSNVFLALLVILPLASEAVAPFNPNKGAAKPESPVVSSRGDLPEPEVNGPVISVDWGLEGLGVDDYDEEEEFIDEIEQEEEEEEEELELEEEIEEGEEEELDVWDRWANFRPSGGFGGQFSPSPFMNIDWNVRVILGDSWWEGPNVCQRFEETEEVLNQGKTISRHRVISSSRCDDLNTVYKCTTELTVNNTKKVMSVVYECCHGYQREHGSSGCSKKLPPLRGIITTLQTMGLKEVTKAIKGVSLNKLLAKKNYTVFAPAEGFIEEYQSIQDQQNTSTIIVVTPELLNLARTLENSVSAHIVPEFLKTAYMEDEELLPTLISGENIRINIYDRPRKLVTANCRPVISSDNLARNGIIHVINGTMPSVKESIAEIFRSHPDLSMFKTLVGHSGLLSMLKRDGQYTLLAPSNAAFARLTPYIRDRLLSGDMCTTDVVKNHVLPNVICSTILENSENDLLTINLLNGNLRITTSDNKLFVEGGQVLERDIMATNGVVHIIDDIIIPHKALTLPQASAALDATIMTDLMVKAKLSDIFTELTNYTAFIPTDEAFGSLPQAELQAILDDPYLLEEMLNYHILNTTEENDDFHGASYDTLANGRQIRISSNNINPFYGKKHTIQCAVIEQADIDTCSGVIHLVDRVLVPPSKSIMEILKYNPEYSELMRLLQLTDLESELNTYDGFLTFLAPTNRAINAMRRSDVDFLEENPDKLKSFLKHHIIKNPMCCSDIQKTHLGLGSAMPALDGNYVFVTRSAVGVHTSGETIMRCDTIATDGIVHSLDHVLEEAVQEYAVPQPQGGIANKLSQMLDQLVENIHVQDKPAFLDRIFAEFRRKHHRAANKYLHNKKLNRRRLHGRHRPHGSHARQMARKHQAFWDKYGNGLL